jgi:hypothetical protein
MVHGGEDHDLVHQMASGHPRTILDHQEMSLRGVQRAQAEDVARAVQESGLQVGMVTDVDEVSRIRIDVFNDPATGDGPWFVPLNHVTPRPGQHVIYTYAKGSPCVLGVMPDENTMWAAPRRGLPDTFFIDDFDVGWVGASGDIGMARWTWAGSGSFAIAANQGVDANHPGIMELHAGNTAGSYQFAYTLGYTQPNSLTEFEFMVGVSGDITGAQFLIGLTNHSTSFAESLTFWYNTPSGHTTWWFRKIVASASTAIDTGLPVVLNHWYIFNFKRLGAGHWRGTVTDVTDPLNPIEGNPVEHTGVSNVTAVYEAFTQCAAVTTTSKVLLVDYLWWARRGLLRGRG